MWLLAGIYVYVSVRELEDYGETTTTAATGLRQASDGLRRAADGLRRTGSALGELPLVGREIEANIRRTARDVEAIATTVGVTAVQARVSGQQTRESARGVALVLGSAVALVSTVPVAVLYALLRPQIARRLTERR